MVAISILPGSVDLLGATGFSEDTPFTYSKLLLMLTESLSILGR